MHDSEKILAFDPPSKLSETSVPSEPRGTSDHAICEVLEKLIRAMEASGQNPVTQLTGYLITEDPTYLPECCHARALARSIGRDKLMELLIEEYMDHHPVDTAASTCL